MARFCTLCQSLGISDFEANDLKPGEKNEELDEHLKIHCQQSHLIRQGLAVGKVASDSRSLTKFVVKKSIPIAKNQKIMSCLRQLLKSRPKDKAIICNECGHRFSSGSMFDKRVGSIRSLAALAHIGAHLGKPMFACRHCNNRFSGKTSLESHLKTTHGLKAQNNFDDLTVNYQNQIVDMLKRCFGRQGAQKDKATSKPKRLMINYYNDPIPSACRDIFENQKSTRVECSKCGFRLIFDKLGSKFSIINHACGHLEKALFTCRHCDFETTNKNLIKRHTKFVHKLGGKSNYDDLSSNYKDDIVAMLTQCFGGRASEQRQCEIKTENCERQVKASLSQFCRALFENRPRNQRAICSDCGARVRLFSGRQEMICSRAIHHASVHFDKHLFACRHCDFGDGSLASMVRHLKNVHKLDCSTKHYDNLLPKYRNEIITILTRCFGQAETSSFDRINKPKENWETLLHFCRGLFKNHVPGTSVQCSMCEKDLQAFQKGRSSLRSVFLVNHACFHLGKDLFACRHCDSRFTSRGTIWIHLNQIHNLSATLENCVDSSETCQQEIMDTIKRCYAESPRLTEKKAVTTFINKKSSLSNYCRRLLFNRDRKAPVACVECGKQLKIFGKSGKFVSAAILINHACRHMGKILFTCRHCEYNAATLPDIKYHIKKDHKRNGKGNYNDLSANYKNDIMDAVTRCFGEN